MVNKFKRLKRCKDCSKPLRHWNQSGYCQLCLNKINQKKRAAKLKGSYNICYLNLGKKNDKYKIQI